MIEIKPSKPFSNGIAYEYFLETFCYRCDKHKTDKNGFCAFVEEGGCPIENAMEDARFDLSRFPSNEIVCIIRDGQIDYWNVCKEFTTHEPKLMTKFLELFRGADNATD